MSGIDEQIQKEELFDNAAGFTEAKTDEGEEEEKRTYEIQQRLKNKIKTIGNLWIRWNSRKSIGGIRSLLKNASPGQTACEGRAELPARVPSRDE